MDVFDTIIKVTDNYEVRMKFVSSPRGIHSSANSKDLLSVIFIDTTTLSNILYKSQIILKLSPLLLSALCPKNPTWLANIIGTKKVKSVSLITYQAVRVTTAFKDAIVAIIAKIEFMLGIKIAIALPTQAPIKKSGIINSPLRFSSHEHPHTQSNS